MELGYSRHIVGNSTGMQEYESSSFPCGRLERSWMQRTVAPNPETPGKAFGIEPWFDWKQIEDLLPLALGELPTH
jgi:hypothetical protein